MKIFLTIISILFFSVVFGQTFDIYKGDTINLTDPAGLKQGHWIVFNPSKTQIIEEGKYLNNKKEGIWKKYYENGKVKHELTYKANKPDGYAKFYYETGIVSEEGLWRNNKWVGEYKFFFENGNLSYEWNYNDQGKRSGQQKYYHSNGKLMIEGDWQEGKESGIIKEYDNTGKLIAEKNFSNGQLDASSVKNYESNSNQNTTNNKIDNNQNNNTVVKYSTTETADKKTLEVFTGTGFNKLYTKDGKVEQEGDFENGILIKGKKFFYNEKGVLTKTVVIKDGRVINVIYEDQK